MGPLILHLFLVLTLAIDGKDDTHARYGKWWEGEARESNRSPGEEGGNQGNTVTVVVRNECEMALSRAFRLFLSQLSPLTCCMLRACPSKACPEVCSNGWEWRGRGEEVSERRLWAESANSRIDNSIDELEPGVQTLSPRQLVHQLGLWRRSWKGVAALFGFIKRYRLFFPRVSPAPFQD